MLQQETGLYGTDLRNRRKGDEVKKGIRHRANLAG
jgi:hypothetical protein